MSTTAVRIGPGVHRPELQRAGQLMRDGTLDELVAFVQGAHTTVVVDAEDLEAARADIKVRETLDCARRLYAALQSSGRDL